MGFFWAGLPPYIIEWSRALLPGEIQAVETGTFQGDSAALLADEFGRCVTIERSESLASAARDRFASDARVTVLQGSSQECLSEAIPPHDTSAFFWLDAHGFYDYTGPDTEENPLLAEIAVVLDARGDAPTVIAIDDARGMGVHPGWPPLDAITALLSNGGYRSAIIDDTLIAAPASLNPDFATLYEHSRICDVSALFHVWPRVAQFVALRAKTDAVVTRLRGR